MCVRKDIWISNKCRPVHMKNSVLLEFTSRDQASRESCKLFLLELHVRFLFLRRPCMHTLVSTQTTLKMRVGRHILEGQTLVQRERKTPSSSLMWHCSKIITDLFVGARLCCHSNQCTPEHLQYCQTSVFCFACSTPWTSVRIFGLCSLTSNDRRITL